MRSQREGQVSKARAGGQSKGSPFSQSVSRLVMFPSSGGLVVGIGLSVVVGAYGIAALGFVVPGWFVRYSVTADGSCVHCRLSRPIVIWLNVFFVASKIALALSAIVSVMCVRETALVTRNVHCESRMLSESSLKAWKKCLEGRPILVRC